MAAITSTQTGPWNDGSTWVGGVAPGDTDTFTIATTHVVTIPDGVTVTVGTSGASGTTAGTINGTGKLIVGSTTGATLILRGDLVLANNSATRVSGFYQLTLNAGSTLTFDASQATTPLSQTYVCGPAASNNPNAAVQINGTSGAHCVVNSNASGGNGRFSQRGFNSRLGRMVATWCDFTRIGDASNPAFNPYLSSTAVEADTFSLTDCTLDSCGAETQAVPITDGTVFSYTRVRRTNSLCTNCVLTAATTALTTGTRAFTDCTFDVPVGNSTNLAGFTFTRCVLYGGWVIGAHSTNKYFFTDCLIRKFNSSGVSRVDVVSNLGGDMTRCIYFCDNASTDNQKWFSNPSGYDVTLNGGHVESTHLTASTGELMSVVTAPGSLRNITIERHTIAYSLGSGSNERSEALVTVTTTSANVGLYFNHNTWIAATEAHVVLGETNSSAAGILKSFKSNISYGTLSPTGAYQYHIHDYDANSAARELAASAADVNYNCGFGLKTPTAPRVVGYNSPFPATVGVNDVNVNPNFVDTTRNLAKWALSRGSAETHAAAMTILLADPSLVPTAYAWVQGGWAPTNALIQNAGHDGVTIGAVEYTSASTGDRVIFGGDADWCVGPIGGNIYA